VAKRVKNRAAEQETEEKAALKATRKEPMGQEEGKKSLRL